MKKWSIVITIILLFMVISCTGEETPVSETPEVTEISTTAPAPSPVSTEETPETLEINSISIESILNISWQWSGLIESEPANQSVVPSPEKYTLLLLDDGTFNFQADCNVGSGTYIADGSSLSLTPGPVTLAACGPESLHDEFLLLLVNATSFGMNGDNLVLITDDGKAQMMYINGGAGEAPTEQQVVCAGIDMESWTLDTMGLSTSWQPFCIPATNYDESQPPGSKGLPEHAQILFGNSSPEKKQINDPVIYIIPVTPYEQLWASNGNLSITNEIDDLQTILVDQPNQFPSTGIPVLPKEEVQGTSDLIVQGDYLNINMGAGLRFVGRFSQGENPVTNDTPQLFYIFEGFTGDGQYLISFFYPVSTDELPNSGEVSDEESQEVNSDYETYLTTTVNELNSLQADDWDPDLTELDDLIISLEFDYQVQEEEPTVTPQLTNINWQWTELAETDPAGQSLVPFPERYVIIFLTDGTIDILSDCNFGGGTYGLNGNEMTITVDAMTEIECDEGSLSEQFVTALGQTASYQLTIPKLTLNFAEDSGRMGFSNGGRAIIPPLPEEGVPTATTIEPVNVRSGPGTAYQSFGIVPAGTSFEVNGISEDGGWWVVRLPIDISASGQGWINANYVETENTENVPVIATPPLEGEDPPEGDVPTATAIEPINVRSGPGTDYDSYGVAPAGSTAVVIGVSADNQWWVIQISTDIASDGRGWINANYVEVQNADNVPVIEAPPLP